MTKRYFKKPSKKKLIGILIAIGILPLCYLMLKLFGIVFTYTGSLPTGFYYQQSLNQDKIHVGQIVSFCLPPNIAKYGYDRGYIGKGNCQGGYSSLMKEVVAVPGNRVVVTNNKLIINNQNYYAPTEFKDSHHLSVKRFVKNGDYTATGYWFYGYGSPNYSWDSRYYGQVPKDNILHVYQPLLTF